MLLKCLMVFGAGGLGAVCRYLIQIATRNQITGFGTWLINSLGCFLIGVFAGWLVNSTCSWSSDGKEAFYLLCMTGFCGGFSTFSTFTLDCVQAFESGKIEMWIIMGTMTVFVGLFGCAIGYWIGKNI